MFQSDPVYPIFPSVGRRFVMLRRHVIHPCLDLNPNLNLNSVTSLFTTKLNPNAPLYPIPW